LTINFLTAIIILFYSSVVLYIKQIMKLSAVPEAFLAFFRYNERKQDDRQDGKQTARE